MITTLRWRVPQAVGAVQTRGWQRRFTIVGLCFVAFMLCNMDRVNMSIAILPMSKQYGWDSATIGLVQSSFFWWAVLAGYVAALLCLVLVLCPDIHWGGRGYVRLDPMGSIMLQDYMLNACMWCCTPM